MIDHEYFMRLALEQAELAFARCEVPVGAVLVDGEGAILAAAHNAPVSLNDPTAHAEVLAIRQAAALRKNYRLPGTVLYATLEPCSMCLGAMIHARVGTLVYGASDPKGGAAGSVVDLTSAPGLNHYVEVVGGVLSDACAQLLQRFFRARRDELKHMASGEVPKWP